jgi:hypothetical protein
LIQQLGLHAFQSSYSWQLTASLPIFSRQFRRRFRICTFTCSLETASSLFLAGTGLLQPGPHLVEKKAGALAMEG